MAKRRVITPTVRVWLIRAGIAVGTGLVVGFGLGVLGVRVLQSPVSASADELPDGTHKTRGPSAVTEEPAANGEPEKPVNGVVVPQLIGLEEGDARQAVLQAGFKVGSVTFKAGPPPMGIVVASFPVPGEAVALPATVNLILSDGKAKSDSVAVPPQAHNNFL